MAAPGDEHLFESLRKRTPPDHRQAPSGAVIGIVTNNQDPEGMGRVKVRFPWLHDSVESHWARIAQIYAGGGRGSFILPEVGDEVCVVFDRRDPNHPYVLGGLWNGSDIVPPPGNPDGENDTKIFRTRSSHQVVFEDKSGAERITIIDGPGKRKLVIDVAADRITLSADPGDITFEAPAESIAVQCKTLDVEVSTDSTWKIDTTLSESCTDRVETITGADTLDVKQNWNVKTSSGTVSASSSTVTTDKASVAVSSNLTLTNAGSRKVSSTVVHRDSGPETATVASLTVTATDTIAFVANGPITVMGGSQKLGAPDVMVTAPVVACLGGLVRMEAKTGLEALASLVTLC